MNYTRIITIMSVVLTLFSVQSCMHPYLPDGGCTYGRGQIIYEEVELGSFYGVVNETVVDVEIVQGDEQSLAIEGYENLIDRMSLSVFNDRLTIDLQPGCYNNIRMKVYITVPAIEEINIQSTGSVTLGDFENLTALDIIVDGTGSVRGTGWLSINDQLYIESESTGKVRLDVDCPQISTYMDGTGSVTLGGSCTYQYVEMDGTGSYKCFNLDSEVCDARVGGTGSAEVYVTDELDARISGVGSIFYRGDPWVKIVDTGVGDLVYVE